MPDWEWLSREMADYSHHLSRQFGRWKDPYLYQDMTQNALIRLWRLWMRGIVPEDESVLLAYGKRVVYTAWVDLFRRENTRKRTAPVDPAVWRIVVQAQTQAHLPEDIVCESESHESIIRVLDSIQGVAGQLLRMRYEEMHYEEIASALGIPLGTVKSRLNYARGVAKKRLAAIN